MCQQRLLSGIACKLSEAREKHALRIIEINSRLFRRNLGGQHVGGIRLPYAFEFMGVRCCIESNLKEPVMDHDRLLHGKGMEEAAGHIIMDASTLNLQRILV